mmetsp:Transcript_2265/g.8206  ORF Transcript_2265/g.8206 Transcript_2265/m.8206 type:complete len:110 (-) Transcript_2265:587-916(-)
MVGIARRSAAAARALIRERRASRVREATRRTKGREPHGPASGSGRMVPRVLHRAGEIGGTNLFRTRHRTLGDGKNRLGHTTQADGPFSLHSARRMKRCRNSPKFTNQNE